MIIYHCKYVAFWSIVIIKTGTGRWLRQLRHPIKRWELRLTRRRSIPHHWVRCLECRLFRDRPTEKEFALDDLKIQKKRSLINCRKTCVVKMVCLRTCVRACVCEQASVRACVRACLRACVLACVRACANACACACIRLDWGPILTRPYFAKLIDRFVNHKWSRMRTNDISGTNFLPGRRPASVEQRGQSALRQIGRPIHETETKYGLARIGPKKHWLCGKVAGLEGR